ncbi:hypothetical protein [Tautonia plasticadhaerens]|uniref:Uncharacterized protein n=1 Tax=Tautonia plasticadhaerens TaxID=2527974 RepID=A0A518H6U7_9BACT|nr:hypothetical protein [Tautonia plasticadhaerens]QDV36545.1 hypothetical protein ElP_44730 [Tautonia plasticadhaerens]
MTRSGARTLISAIASGILAGPGCSDDRALVVATTWDRPTCRAVRSRLLAEGEAFSSPVRWLRLDPWDDPGRVIGPGSGVDVLLGWHGPTLRSLDRRGLLADPGDGWVWAPRVEGDGDAGPGEDRPGIPFASADPRIDPGAGWSASEVLGRGDWARGYALLLGRGAARPDPQPGIEAGGWAALPAGSDHPDAPRFLAAVAALAGGPGPGPSPVEAIEPGLVVLQAELIGATVIDAAPELRDAWDAVGRSPDPGALRAELVEPPPWPPASIQALRSDPTRRSLLGTLAGALVDDEEARGWLLDSWGRPARPIDRATLIELARVADGRMLDEAQFLPWLRAEWTAWARQRYARVVRPGPSGGGES